MNLLYQRGKTAASLLLEGKISDLTRRTAHLLKNGFIPLVDEDQIKPQLIKALKYLKDITPKDQNQGDYLEFGVSHGSSMLLMYQALAQLRLDDVRLFGFDSFEGLPKEADDEGKWKKGQFAANMEEVNRYFTKNGIDMSKVTLEKGWFRETLTPAFKANHQINKASIIMIDCDIYYSTVDALKFCEDILADQSIIIFDDWGPDEFSKKRGEQQAFDEFLKRNSHIKTEEIGKYTYKGNPAGKIFAVYSHLETR